MSNEAITWEKQVMTRARTAAAELIDAAVELRWYTDDPLGAAMGHVEAVLASRGHYSPTPNEDLPRKRKPLPSRAVWDRDGWTCQRCGGHADLTVDHIQPWSLGGSNDMDNLQTLCGTCNSRKGAR